MGNFKRTLAVLFIFIFIAALVFAGNPARKIAVAGNSSGKSQTQQPYAPGEVLVKFKKGVTLDSVNQIAAMKAMAIKKHFRVLSKMKGSEYVLLRSSKANTLDMLNELAGNPAVEAASPNYRNWLDATPNDTRYSELWGMHNTGQTGGTADADIDAPEAWNIATGSTGTIVAVIDTGLDYRHPDLAANAWVNALENSGSAGVDDDGNGYIDDKYGIDPAGTNGSTPDTDPMDGYGHGTHCAGTIGAVGNNSLGVAGVNWNVKIMGLKFFDDAGGNGYDSFAIECIEYAIDKKVNYAQNVVAINASWGGAGFNQLLKDAIDAAGTAGIVFCAASGNGGSDGVGDNNDSTPHYPSSYTSASLISVAATDDTDLITGFSNYGVTSVDLGAPGAGILSTVPGAYIPQAGDIFFDNMEGGVGNWTHGGTLDSWAITENQEGFANASFPVPSPTHFWSDRVGASYLADTDSWLAYGADIDLSSYTGQDVYLGIGSAVYIEGGGYDHGYVELSSDSGATWTPIFDFSGYANYWSSYSWLIPESFKTSHFRFRFRLTSDDSYQYWGWLIDNVGIGTTKTYGYEAWDGTSMATPHVAGAVALMAAQFPIENAAARISRILSNVDANTSLTGKCVTGGRLNLYNAISYIAPPAITVTSPNGGESWTAGTSHDITWSSTGTIANVSIDYSINNGGDWINIVQPTANDGSWTWTVPNTPSANCLVRVQDQVDGVPSDVSNAVFSIIGSVSDTITVVSPNGGESWTQGTSHDITWSSTGTIANVHIYYSTDNGSSWGLVAANTSNDGSESWTVPNEPSTTCLVRVRNAAGTEPSDQSNAVFTIVGIVTPTITVTSPNGGESWTAGTQHDITWTSTGTVGGVDILCSTNNGASWPQIVSNTANDGTYEWTVSDTPSEYCLVRVQENDGDPGDQSNTVFTIVAVETVSTPTTPTGPASGTISTSYDYSTGGSTSSLGHSVQYFFDWDDGSDSGWLAVGTTQASHSWSSAGTYDVRAMARCATHTAIESLWSTAHVVTITDGGTTGYYNSPAQRLILPEATWAPASGGGDWTSELQLVDSSGGSVVQVYYNTGTSRRGPFTLWSNGSGAAGSSVIFSNIVQAIDGLDGAAFTYYGSGGALELVTQDGSHLLQAAVRSYNGNFSRTFPALADVETNTAASGRSLLIPNISNDGSYRPSVVLFNPSADSVTVAGKIIGSDGAQVGSTINRTLAGYEQNTIVTEVRSNTYSNGDFLVNVTAGSGRVIASGQSANNASNDPAAHVAVQTASGYANSMGSRLILPETTWAPASGGGDWVSEVHVSDLSGGAVITVYYNTGTSRRGPFTLWTNGGGANRSVTFGNILQTIDGLDGSATTYYGTGGSLELMTQDGSHLIQAAVRTYNGNFSRTFPALLDREETTAASGRVLLIPNICNNSMYRPSVVLFNPSADSVTVEVKIIGSDGAQVGSTINRSLAGYQQNTIVDEVRAFTYDNAKVQVQVTGGAGRVIASGQSANNASNDPAAHIAVQGQ